MRTSKTIALVAGVIATFALGAPGAMATTIRSGTTTIGSGATFDKTLKISSSSLFKDTSGLANDTCTGLHIHGNYSIDIIPPLPTLEVTELNWTGCSHTTTTIAKGSMEYKSIAGTTNGTVISKGMRVTMKSTVFGISCVANTGAGTTLGTLTGVTSGSATMDINGVVTLENGCGDSTWTASVAVNTPSGLNVEG